MAKLSPLFNDQTFTAEGAPAVGYKLFTYAAGSSTKLSSYSDESGSIKNSNPIIINNDGYPTQGAIWLQEGLAYKFVLALPTDNDPPTSPVKTFDNITGVGDNTISFSQWVSSGAIPIYVSPNSFTVLGDLTSEFHLGRMIQAQTAGGTVYGKIISSIFTSLTTVTLQMDSGQVLDSQLSVVNLSFLRADNQALPNPIEFIRSTVAATATTTPLWDRAYGEVQDWTGTPTITSLPNAPRAGSQRQVYPAAGTIMTHGGNISVQGNASATAAAGDKWEITAITNNTFYVVVVKKNGESTKPIVLLDIVPVRQTVLAGSVDANGQANYLSSGTGLTINLAATSVPVEAAFAAGFGANGQIDYVSRTVADLVAAWTVPANLTSYLYEDRNTVTGAKTYGSTTLAPNYGWGIAKSTVNGQHTYRIDEGVMYVGNGSAAVVVQRVFHGECVTNASAVTSVKNYALRGQYESPLSALPVNSSGIILDSNLGLNSGVSADLIIENVIAEQGYNVGDTVHNPPSQTSTLVVAANVWTSRNTAGFFVLSAGFAISSRVSGGVAYTITPNNWKFRVQVRRDW